jgi:hypothetical protein
MLEFVTIFLPFLAVPLTAVIALVPLRCDPSDSRCRRKTEYLDARRGRQKRR